MNDETIIKLARTMGGVALLITHAVTAVDGQIILIAMVLLGVPFELAKKQDTRK